MEKILSLWSSDLSVQPRVFLAGIPDSVVSYNTASIHDHTTNIISIYLHSFCIPGRPGFWFRMPTGHNVTSKTLTGPADAIRFFS